MAGNGRPVFPAIDTKVSKEMATIKTLALTDYSTEFFVREKLDERRVQMFEGLYTRRAPVPELVLGKIKDDESGKLYLVDGRTRDAALRRMGRTHAEFEVRTYDSLADMIADALKMNYGGSLPPTEGDILHTVRIMVESGVTLTNTCRLLAFIGPKIVRELYGEAEKQIIAASMIKARKAVAGGMAVADAANRFQVPKPKLQRLLAGESKQPVKSVVGQLEIRISNRFKALAPAMTKVLMEVSRMFQSGELSEKDTVSIYSHLRKLHNNVSASIDEAERRLKALPIYSNK